MRLWLLFLVLISMASASEIKVATLHPLLADLAAQVGGDRVEIVELVERNSDPHHFEPTPKQIREAGDIDLCLASGMGLESYLPSLRSLLPRDAILIDIGSKLPALEGACDHPGHAPSRRARPRA